MTEVDAVMLEGGASAPTPQLQTTNTTTAAADSSLSNQSDNDAVAASNNGELTLIADNNPVKIRESVTAAKEAINDIDSASADDQSAKTDTTKPSQPTAVSEDCDGGAVTTTAEQEGEEDSQITSSTDVDGREESTRKQRSGNVNSVTPPLNSLTENSNSQSINDNDNESEGEADADVDASSQSKALDAAQEDTTTNACETTSQSCDSVSNQGGDASTCNNSQNDIPKKETKNSKAVIALDGEEENSVSSEQQNKASSNAVNSDDDGDSDVVVPEDADPIKPKSSSPSAKASSTPTDNEEKNAVKSHVADKPKSMDVVERMEVDEDDIDEHEDPLANANPAVDPLCEAKNGDISDAEKTATDKNGSIVDLGDDDSEDESTSKMGGAHANEDTSNGAEEVTNSRLGMRSNLSGNKRSSVCSDSDGAVVIGSDSENETGAPALKIPPASIQQLNPNPPTQTIEDDDDDCVVIEDDSPLELTPNSDQNKRKTFAMDPENNSDDSQPPSKRQRSGAISQIAIKDARSLTPADISLVAGNGKKNINEAGIYPVNITPAGSSIPVPSGPPKLAPIGGGNVPATLGALPGLAGLNANANLLPGLTEDMFVLEAPSFIVPYIYEKPPSDSLRDIVKEIETKYELTKEDLVEADKSDEFDMITEQNKDDKDPPASQSSKKKKKKRYTEDPDDSWSEETDEEDDDEDEDDSDSATRTKVLIREATDDLTALKGAIKPASAVTQSVVVGAPNVPAKPGQENYFESPLGKFFMDIGVGLVQEYVQTDLIRLQKRKMRRCIGINTGDFERAIAALSGNVEASKKKNAPFKFTMKRCEFCHFKSESALAMAHHYETPHMNGPLYKCNFCTFEIRNATEIVYHMEAMHNIKARLIKPLPYHQCPNCGFEDNGKAKLARHQPVCAKKFRPELNLAPPNDWEAPAKIPRIKPRHGLVGTATAYQAMAAQAAAQKAALATIQQQQQQAQARNIQAAALAAQNAAHKIRGRSNMLPKGVGGGVPGPNGTAPVALRGASPVGPRPMATNVVLPNNYQLPGNQIMQQTNVLHAAAKKTSLPGQPSISITPLPRQNAMPQAPSPSTSKMPAAGIKPGQSPTGNKTQFVICEICDGYIKDLEQLRNHMQWMHKVKIHPKMIYNRPPLNCQKCQFRFFTDQGLERHLLGSHGLVTSSMQEAANKGKDAGRCPVCGRMYQWKLLNHVARDHHMTLKPAHLSYKCTVCTATFGMYKQFETHVYTAHSTVTKKAMDSKKNNTASPGIGNSTASNVGGAGSSLGASGSMGQRGGVLSTAATNDALLKPLKINDEITIIPQPASKPRITNMESHVID